jgi:DNA-binding MarR family transcriptional regulator
MNPSSLKPTTLTEGSKSYWLLLQLMFEAKHQLAALAEVHGLTMMQANVLAMLEPGSPRPMNTLSEMLNCDASNVTGLVDRLVKHGAIARQDDPDDRRVKMIILTKAGVALRLKLVDEMSGAEDARLGSILSSEERKAFHALLVRISNR